MKKITLYTLLMFSIFSCFRKKTPPASIEAWLDKEFPGQFQVLDSNLKMLDVMAQFKGDKQALIAAKSDPDVQFLLDWNKRDPSLGVEASKVQDWYHSAKTNAATAHELYTLLKDKGLDHHAVYVYLPEILVLVFSEPNFANREAVYSKVLTVMQDWKGSRNVQIGLKLMEPTVYHTQFQDIVPMGHFYQGAGWQKDNELLSIDIPSNGLADKVLHWNINPESRRCSLYQKVAFEQAKEWVKKNVPKAYFLDQHQLFSVESINQFEKGGKAPKSNTPAIRFSFPYFDQQPVENDTLQLEPIGYVSGVFRLDEQIFSDIKLQKEY